MSDLDEAANDRTSESAELLVEPDDGDAADTAGLAAAGTADKMHDEVDAIAEDADPRGPGHGSAADEAAAR